MCRSTRRLVENAIGILKEKFPCLNYLRLEPAKACRVFQCCVALCNLSRDNEDVPELGDIDNVEDEDIEDEEHNEGVAGAEHILQGFYNHFV